MTDAISDDKPKKASIKAKKDFRIVQNDVDIVIEKGKPLPEVPEKFIENLKTEGVI